MKKTIILFAIVVLGTTVSLAQAPDAFKYQAVARDATGAVLANKSVSFRISILLGTVTGAIVYSERHNTNTNEFGLVNLEIGKGITETGSMAGIDWSTGPYFIKVEMDKDGGSNFLVLGTSQLMSVPYALFANSVKKGDDWGQQAALTDLTLAGNGSPVQPLGIAQQDAKPGQSLQWNGETWKPGDNMAIGGTTGQVQFNNAGALGGDPKLFWDNANKRLGLGTDAPFGDLDIRGSYHSILNVKAPYDAILRLDRTLPSRWATINFLDNGNSDYWMGLNGNSNFSISRFSDKLTGLEVRENGDVAVSNNLFVNLYGKVGLGVTNPTYPLEIMTNQTPYIRFFHALSGSEATDGLLIGMQQSGDQAWIWNYENGPVHIGTNNSYRMTIKASGEVGIGTFNPVAKLHVVSDSDILTPHLLLTENGTDYSRLMFKNTSAPNKNWTVAGYSDDNNLASRLNFYYSDGTAGSDLLSITGGGRVLQAKTGDSHLLPIAYGDITLSGTITTGTDNFTCTWNGTDKRYEISITGESYNYASYTTVVTASGSSPLVAMTNSVSGKLLVTLFNIQGTAVQGIFQFVTYKK